MNFGANILARLAERLLQASHSAAFAIFLAMLVFLPLPLGTNRYWISDAVAVFCSLPLILLCLALLRGDLPYPKDYPAKTMAIAGGLFLAAVAWGFLQAQPWTPSAWHHPLWQDVQGFPDAFSGAISLTPALAVEHISRLLLYAACFAMAFFWGRDRERAKRLVMALAIAAVAYALYGLTMQASGLRMVLWYEKWAYRDFVTSTFVNKNSYATYASLGLLCCLALLWRKLSRTPRLPPSPDASQLTAFVEWVGVKGMLYTLPAIVTLGALFMTASRAGVASGLAGCFAFLAALAVNRRWGWKKWLPMGLAVLAVCLAVAAVGDLLLLDRMDQHRVESDTPVRLTAYAVTLRAIESNPWLGFGLGSFEGVFRIYRDPSMLLWFQHAHNDYLEVALELGLPAALSLWLAVVFMIVLCAIGLWKRKRDAIYPALALGASVTVGLHSLADFSMHIPAVAATYASILGLGVAQSWSSGRK